MTLNSDEFPLAQESVKFSHIINGTEAHPNLDKIKAIDEVIAPTNVGEVCHFMGMTKCKFFPQLAEITQPIQELLVKGNV